LEEGALGEVGLGPLFFEVVYSVRHDDDDDEVYDDIIEEYLFSFWG